MNSKFFQVIVFFSILVLMGCRKESPILQQKTRIPGISIKFQELNDTINLRGIHFINDNHGFICGYNGSILKTENHGDTWNQLKSPVALPLYSIDFIDVNTGFIVGGERGCHGTGCEIVGPVILKTVDGGNTWIKKEIESPDNWELHAVHFIDDSTGFAVGGKTIFHTSNRGESWHANRFENLNGFLRDITFMEDFGVAVGSNGVVLTSRDKGETWSDNSSTAIKGVASVTIAENLTTHIAGNSNVYQSSDLGKSWDVLTTSPVDNYNLNRTNEVLFSFGRGLYSGGDFGYHYGSLFFSTDGGQNWQGTKSVVETNVIHDSSFPSDKLGFFVSRNIVARLELE